MGMNLLLLVFVLIVMMLTKKKNAEKGKLSEPEVPLKAITGNVEEQFLVQLALEYAYHAFPECLSCKVANNGVNNLAQERYIYIRVALPDEDRMIKVKKEQLYAFKAGTLKDTRAQANQNEADEEKTPFELLLGKIQEQITNVIINMKENGEKSAIFELDNVDDGLIPELIEWLVENCDVEVEKQEDHLLIINPEEI